MPAAARAIAGVADSKLLDPAERERLAGLILARAQALALGAASVREIGERNIYQATALAMRRALARLSVVPDAVLVDGKPIRTLGVEHTAVVKGDNKCYAIACASIVAKVVRDRLMQRLDARYPVYAWRTNAGYGTPVHIQALNTHGLTAHHRVSFCRSVLERELELEF